MITKNDLHKNALRRLAGGIPKRMSLKCSAQKHLALLSPTIKRHIIMAVKNHFLETLCFFTP